MSETEAQSFRIDPADLPDEAVIFGHSAAMGEIRDRIHQVLDWELPVLVQGESGTGKEVIARFLHSHSNRRNAPFVKLNCAAIPAGLLESELFGYQKGSFTGAKEDRPGLIEIAEGGTVFLDEIGELHHELQAKLFHLLGDGSFTRIGADKERRGNIRVICATNVDLHAAVDSGVFRADLFHRIDVVSLILPSLRERKDDIPLLCEHFLSKLAQQFGRTLPKLSPETMNLLVQWNWPGNLRELENWVARAIILGNADALGTEMSQRMGMAAAHESRKSAAGSLKEASRQAAAAASNALILRILQANRWNRRKTAEDLNMSYRSLLYKLREAGLPQRRRSHRGFPPAAH